MVRPNQQDLQTLRLEAKFLHRALTQGSPEEQRAAAQRFQQHPNMRGKTLDLILSDARAGRIQRKHAFGVVAAEAGFPSWEEYIAEVHQNPLLERAVREVVASGARNVYIAIMPIDNDDGTESFHLEVELPWYEIQGNYDTGHFEIGRARTLADHMEKLLRIEGLHVYQSSEDWEVVQGADVFAPSRDVLAALYDEGFDEDFDASGPDLRVLRAHLSEAEQEVIAEVRPDGITFRSGVPGSTFQYIVPSGAYRDPIVLDAHYNGMLDALEESMDD